MTDEKKFPFWCPSFGWLECRRMKGGEKSILSGFSEWANASVWGALFPFSIFSLSIIPSRLNVQGPNVFKKGLELILACFRILWWKLEKFLFNANYQLFVSFSSSSMQVFWRPLSSNSDKILNLTILTYWNVFTEFYVPNFVGKFKSRKKRDIFASSQFVSFHAKISVVGQRFFLANDEIHFASFFSAEMHIFHFFFICQ